MNPSGRSPGWVLGAASASSSPPTGLCSPRPALQLKETMTGPRQGSRVPAARPPGHGGQRAACTWTGNGCRAEAPGWGQMPRKPGPRGAVAGAPSVAGREAEATQRAEGDGAPDTGAAPQAHRETEAPGHCRESPEAGGLVLGQSFGPGGAHTQCGCCRAPRRAGQRRSEGGRVSRASDSRGTALRRVAWREVHSTLVETLA